MDEDVRCLGRNAYELSVDADVMLAARGDGTLGLLVMKMAGTEPCLLETCARDGKRGTDTLRLGGREVPKLMLSSDGRLEVLDCSEVDRVEVDLSGNDSGSS